MLFFFKQKTAYELRISDWSSDVCSSDLCFHEHSPAGTETAQRVVQPRGHRDQFGGRGAVEIGTAEARGALERSVLVKHHARRHQCHPGQEIGKARGLGAIFGQFHHGRIQRSEERRGGKEWVSTGSTRGSADQKKKKKPT